MISRSLLVGLLALPCLVACSKDDKTNLIAKVVDAAADASAVPAGPKNLELAKPALVKAKEKYAKHEPVDAECAPLMSLKADFADSKDPDAVKTAHEIDVFCEIDVALELQVATLKNDNAKLADAVKKKDKNTEQMYAATVKDGCASIREQLAALTAKHLETDPKVRVLQLDVDPICNAPATAKKK